jgi:hypothetical protein
VVTDGLGLSGLLGVPPAGAAAAAAAVLQIVKLQPSSKSALHHIPSFPNGLLLYSNARFVSSCSQTPTRHTHQLARTRVVLLLGRGAQLLL